MLNLCLWMHGSYGCMDVWMCGYMDCMDVWMYGLHGCMDDGFSKYIIFWFSLSKHVLKCSDLNFRKNVNFSNAEAQF